MSRRRREEAQDSQPVVSLSGLLLHLLCLLIYVVPVLFPSQFNNDDPVLDELHIISAGNHDVNGDSNWTTIFSNDYWGRPMSKSDSHKSWRPLTVLTFRYLKGGDWLPSDLMAHRIVNIVAHACIAELVSILAVKLYVSPKSAAHGQTWLLRAMTKLVFALHPTHVEVTANAANRGHLLAVLCSVVLADPDIPFAVFLTCLIAGFLASETFLFQVVPAAVTLAAICYIRHFHKRRWRVSPHWTQQLYNMLYLALPRVMVLGMGAVAYYVGRWYYDTLSIPEGLIRPAENPFFEFTGWHRVRNYAYVLAIHVAKAWDLDFVGFSHEYGRECITPIDSWKDERLYIPQAIVAIYVAVLLVLLSRQKNQKVLSLGFIWYLVHLSWMLTLFPVSGVVKVGTFISDRIVVAASVSTSMLVAYLAFSWISRASPKGSSLMLLKSWQKILLLTLMGAVMSQRIYLRCLDWVDSLPLLQSSLKTCPRFAKAHVEVSKIYSGLYPKEFDLGRSRYHLEQAERIDPDFCDVHQQFAHIAIQEKKYIEFEERLTQALMCPFTLGGSTGLWKQYWETVLDTQKNPMESVQAAKARYDKYMVLINQEIEREKAKDSEKETKNSSPLAWNRKEKSEL